MFTGKLVRNVFIPTAALVAEKNKNASSSADCVCKPSELPIYTSEVDRRQKAEPCLAEEPGAIEQTFGSVRRTLFTLMSEVKTLQRMGEDYVNTGIDSAQGLINYLQQEDNTTPKYGAVALGGLAGLILGLRGGKFKRALYTSAGALGMAAVCYPKEAAEYSQTGIAEAKHYATIAYNFIHGVKKDDPPLALPSLPDIPGSISEAWDAAKNLGKSSKSPVTDDSTDSCAIKGKGKEVIPEAEIDALCVISEAHATATNKSCHCPIGACMGHHEGSPPKPDPEEEPSCGTSGAF